MAPGRAHPALVSAWLLFLCSVVSAEPDYMQVVQSCERDEASGAVRAVTRYALNGEDVLQYHGDQNRLFSVHPAAWRVAERWNRERETLAGITRRSRAGPSSGSRRHSPRRQQIRVSIELGLREHMCMVRNISLGGTPLRISWDPQATGQAGSLGVLAGCMLAALGATALGRYLRGRPGRSEGPYRPAQTQPGTPDSALAKPGDTLATATAPSCPGITA
ncbi:unnamed protein product [Eretmochelys imbricata]